MSVSIQGEAVEINFYVTDEFICPMILGANWIMKSGAILQSDGTKFEVAFGGKKEKVWFSKRFCTRPHTMVEVDGIGKVEALVDSGAACSVIRRDVLTDSQMSKAIPASDIVVAANGNQIKTDGLVSLNVTHHGIKTCMETIQIQSSMSSPVILGMDWIHRTGVVIKSDGWKLIASPPDLPPKQKKSERLSKWLSKKWSSTCGSISRISSLASNLM